VSGEEGVSCHNDQGAGGEVVVKHGWIRFTLLIRRR